MTGFPCSCMLVKFCILVDYGRPSHVFWLRSIYMFDGESQLLVGYETPNSLDVWNCSTTIMICSYDNPQYSVQQQMTSEFWFLPAQRLQPRCTDIALPARKMRSASVCASERRKLKTWWNIPRIGGGYCAVNSLDGSWLSSINLHIIGRDRERERIRFRYRDIGKHLKISCSINHEIINQLGFLETDHLSCTMPLFHPLLLLHKGSSDGLLR